MKSHASFERLGYPSLVETEEICSELMAQCNRLDREIADWELKAQETENTASVYETQTQKLQFNTTLPAQSKSAWNVDDMLLCSAALRCFRDGEGECGDCPWPPEDIAKLQQLCGTPSVERLTELLDQRLDLEPDELRLHFRHLRPILEEEVKRLTVDVAVKEQESSKLAREVSAVERLQVGPTQTLPDQWVEKLPPGFLTDSYDKCSVMQLHDGYLRVKQDLADELLALQSRRKVAERDRVLLCREGLMNLDKFVMLDNDNSNLAAMLEEENAQLQQLNERAKYQFEEVESAKLAVSHRQRDQEVAAFKRKRLMCKIQRKWRQRREITLKKLRVVLRVQLLWRLKKSRLGSGNVVA